MMRIMLMRSDTNIMHSSIFLEFSIHEMPTGILNGMNGAGITDIPAMLKDIEEFEYLSKN